EAVKWADEPVVEVYLQLQELLAYIAGMLCEASAGSAEEEESINTRIEVVCPAIYLLRPGRKGKNHVSSASPQIGSRKPSTLVRLQGGGLEHRSPDRARCHTPSYAFSRCRVAPERGYRGAESLDHDRSHLRRDAPRRGQP